MLTVKKASPLFTENHRSCKAREPSILRSHAERCTLPICGRYIHLAVHHNRPISVSFLDRRRGREKLKEEAVTMEGEKDSHELEYRSIRPSASCRQTYTSQVFLSLASQLPILRQARSSQRASSPSLSNAPRRAPPVLNQPRATQSRRIRNVRRPRGKLTWKPSTRHPPVAPRSQRGRSPAASS